MDKIKKTANDLLAESESYLVLVPKKDDPEQFDYIWNVSGAEELEAYKRALKQFLAYEYTDYSNGAEVA
jgi:hypothetical protein